MLQAQAKSDSGSEKFFEETPELHLEKSVVRWR